MKKATVHPTNEMYLRSANPQRKREGWGFTPAGRDQERAAELVSKADRQAVEYALDSRLLLEKPMRPVSPSQRVTINESPKGIEIVISARRSIFITLLYALLIVIWAIVEIPLIYFSYEGFRNRSDPNTPLLLALLACTLFGGFGIYAWIYNLVGKERIFIKYRSLSIKQEIYGFGITWKYDLNRVTNLRMGIQVRGLKQFIWSNPELWIPFGGQLCRSIVFDYKGDTYQFGTSINETDAQIIINELQKHHDFTRAV